MKHKTTIVLAMDESYYHKALKENLFASLEANFPTGRICMLAIGFHPNESPMPQRAGAFEVATCTKESLAIYHPQWPYNRPGYVCAEAGDFIAYFHFEPDEIIIHIDGDVVMQRRMTEDELEELYYATRGKSLACTLSRIPKHTLWKEYQIALKGTLSRSELEKAFPEIDLHRFTYCMGLMAARVDTWKDIFMYYKLHFNRMIKAIPHHHAGSMFLLNYLVYRHLYMEELPHHWHTADWFVHSRTNHVKDGLLYHENQMVIFNHTKFRHPKAFLK